MSRKRNYIKVAVFVMTIVMNYTLYSCRNKINKVEKVYECNCEHKPYDKNDYLYKICVYIKEEKFDVSPGSPCEYEIRKIVSKNDSIDIVYLTCCYLGDVAKFNKKTGKLLRFDVGDK